MVKAKKFILARHFEGMPTPENFELIEEELPELEQGQYLVEALFFSVDPYMRVYVARMLTEGTTMIGSQVGKVIASKNQEYPVGKMLVASFGWRTHTLVDPNPVVKDKLWPLLSSIKPLPDMGNLPASLGLGAIGMPGNTAYFGFLEICQPKEGDVVVVSGAAGAVGSLVGQIAKIKGCYVIGYAGEDDKVKWLEELGFDKAYNYKKVDWNQSLKEAAPNGVDCYFDNVGGLFSATVRSHMKLYGRISVCGAISTYNDKEGAPTMVISPDKDIVSKQLRIEGFNVQRWVQRWMEGLTAMTKWINEGKIQVKETHTEGFVNLPKAFIEMLEGKNTGKAIIKA